MTIDTSIGLDDPRSDKQSGITDEAREKEARRDGDAVGDEAKGDLTAEDIARGNDRNTSADERGRDGKSNKLPDEGIRITDH